MLDARRSIDELKVRKGVIGMYSVAIIEDDAAQRDLLATMIKASPLACKLKVIPAPSALFGASGEVLGSRLSSTPPAAIAVRPSISLS